MLKYRIIPCLDIKDGRVVKGVNFENLTDAGDPVAVAKRYNEQGADELCILDINASHDNRCATIDVIQAIADTCFMPVTVGGGVKTVDDIYSLLHAGADKVSINTAAVARPALIEEGAKQFGSQCIVAAIDARRCPVDEENGVSWVVCTHGGRKRTNIDVVAFAKTVEMVGAGEILLTSMDADGTKDGYDIELTKAVVDEVGIPVIASGGVGTLKHLVDGIVCGASAVLVASLFHYGIHTIHEAKEYMDRSGIPVRLK
jgi:cyclase